MTIIFPNDFGPLNVLAGMVVLTSPSRMKRKALPVIVENIYIYVKHNSNFIETTLALTIELTVAIRESSNEDLRANSSICT